MSNDKLQIDPELSRELGELEDSEYAILELEILAGECNDPIHVWKCGADLVIVDGHNNFKIRQKHGLDLPPIIEHEFSGKPEALVWMRKRQLGRRNINGLRRMYLIGKVWMATPKVDHRPKEGEAKEENKAANLAGLYGVDDRYLRKAAQLAADVDCLPKQLKEAYLAKFLRIKNKQIEPLAKKLAGNPDRAEIVKALLNEEKTVDQVLGKRGDSAAVKAYRKVKAHVNGLIRNIEDLPSKTADEKRRIKRASVLLKELYEVLGIAELEPAEKAEKAEKAEA